MLHMLDTDTCNYIVRQDPPSVERTMWDRIAAEHKVCMSVVTYTELMEGAESVDGAKGREFLLQIAELRRTCDVMKWNPDCDRKFAELKAAYVREHPRSNFGNIRNDVMIASHALALGAVVVTNNERDFARIRRVGGPVWENWVSDV